MRLVYPLIAIAIPVALGACDNIPFLGGDEGDPAESARLFWQSLVDGNLEGARQYALPGTRDQVELGSDDAEVTDLQVQAAMVEGDVANVPTSLRVSAQGTDVELEFDTEVVRLEGEWLVDAEVSLENMGRNAVEALLGSSVEELGQAFGEALGQAFEGMAEGMTEGMQEAAQQTREPQRTSRPAGPKIDDAEEMPWNPDMTGTIEPGMSREDVIGTWGEPVTERFFNNRTFMFYRNGCEVSCGTYDLVILEGNQVVDAVVRGPGHEYTGMSSSPPTRVAEPTQSVEVENTESSSTEMS